MSNLPAYLQNMPKTDRVDAVLANLGTVPQPYVSIGGGRFTLVDVTGAALPIPKLELDAVIIDLNPHKSKTFFGLNKAYDAGNPSPPICWSDNGVAPSVSASQPQHATCSGCPHDVWGSKISQLGSQVKQCADHQKIAIYIPEYSPAGLWLLRIPGGSFTNFKNYALKIKESELRVFNIWTRIGFEQGKTGILTFASPGYISEAVAPTVTQMVTSHAANAMIGLLDRPREGVAPSQTITAASSAADPAPASLIPGLTAAPPTDPVAPPRRRGPRRQLVEPKADPAQPEQAPFRTAEPPANSSNFGITENAPAPPAGLAETLDAVFK